MPSYAIRADSVSSMWPYAHSDGEYAVAEWTSSAPSLAGREYVNDYPVAFRVRDGLIVEVTEYTDTDHLRRVLFPDG